MHESMKEQGIVVCTYKLVVNAKEVAPLREKNLRLPADKISHLSVFICRSHAERDLMP